MKDYSETIKSLVVAYRAFGNAVEAQDENEIIVWGGILLDAQEELSVEVRSMDSVYRAIRTIARVEPEDVL